MQCRKCYLLLATPVRSFGKLFTWSVSVLSVLFCSLFLLRGLIAAKDESHRRGDKGQVTNVVDTFFQGRLTYPFFYYSIKALLTVWQCCQRAAACRSRIDFGHKLCHFFSDITPVLFPLMFFLSVGLFRYSTSLELRKFTYSDVRNMFFMSFFTGRYI